MSALNAVVSPTRHAAPTVRSAMPADYPAIREVVIAAYVQHAENLPREVLPRYLADLLGLVRHTDHGQLMVAEIDGQIRGSAAFYPDSSVQGVGWPPGWAGGRGLAVHPGARGQGIAGAMLGESERLARAAGARAFAFHTASFMTGAIALYETLGYRRAPDFDVDLNAYYGLTGAIPTMAIAYVRHLTPARRTPR